MSKLTVDLKVGETLAIGDATVRLEKKSGQLARLVITADEDVVIATPARSKPAGTIVARTSALQTSGAHPNGKHPV